MNDIDRKEDSWIRKLPIIILVLAGLIFIIVIFSNHNQYQKWKRDQAELTGRFRQTTEELTLLKEANGSLREVTKKVESLQNQAADTKVSLEKLRKEKSTAEADLARLHQELSNLNELVTAGRKKVAGLTKEAEDLETTNQRLRDDIASKKNVLDSIVFLQRQKPTLEQSIKDLETRNNLAAQAESEQQTRLEALQDKIDEGEAAIKEQNEQRAALRSELSGLEETIKKLTSEKEQLTVLYDHQQRLEYLDQLQLQKEALETSINSLLEQGRMLEEENAKQQENAPAR